MKDKKIFLALILFITILAYFGCAQKPPTKEIADARLAVVSALRNKAGVYAPDKLLKAEKYLKIAIIKNRQQSYKEARMAALNAYTLAEEARKIAEQKKQELVKKTTTAETTAKPVTQISESKEEKAETTPQKVTKKAEITAPETTARTVKTSVKKEEEQKKTTAPQKLTAAETKVQEKQPKEEALQVINEQLEYNKIITDYLNNKDIDVVSRFAEFIKKYPNSKFVPNALYWSGENYYDKLDYAKALEYFKRVVDEYPTSYKASAALLKMGYCYYEMGKYDKALEILQQVINEFPNSDEVPKALAKIEQIKKETKK